MEYRIEVAEGEKDVEVEFDITLYHAIDDNGNEVVSPTPDLEAVENAIEELAMGE